MKDRRRGSLAGALAALAVVLGFAAAPAHAQDIANPVGTAFSGTTSPSGTPQATWTFANGALVVRCTGWSADGTPPPATVGVVPNTIGGPSTRMARFAPQFGGCTATRGTSVVGAAVGISCGWAYAVDAFTSGTGMSTPRLQIGLGCANAQAAVSIIIPSFSCQLVLAPHTLVDNGTSVDLGGQNFPGNPFGGAGMTVSHSASDALTGSASGCVGLGAPPLPGSMSATIHLVGAWAGP